MNELRKRSPRSVFVNKLAVSVKTESIGDRQRLCNDANDITNDSQIVTPLDIIIMHLLLRIQLNKVNSRPVHSIFLIHYNDSLLVRKYEKMTGEELFD